MDTMPKTPGARWFGPPMPAVPAAPRAAVRVAIRREVVPRVVGSSFFDVGRHGTPMVLDVWNPTHGRRETAHLSVVPAAVRIIDVHGRPVAGFTPSVGTERLPNGWTPDDRSVFGTQSDAKGIAYVYIPVEWIGLKLWLNAVSDTDDEPEFMGQLSNVQAPEAILNPFTIQVTRY